MPHPLQNYLLTWFKLLISSWWACWWGLIEARMSYTSSGGDLWKKLVYLVTLIKATVNSFLLPLTKPCPVDRWHSSTLCGTGSKCWSPCPNATELIWSSSSLSSSPPEPSPLLCSGWVSVSYTLGAQRRSDMRARITTSSVHWCHRGHVITSQPNTLHL